MTLAEVLTLVGLLTGFLSLLALAFIVLPLLGSDNPVVLPSTVNARKRRSPRTAYVTIQTYFTITESPFALPIALAYGAKVAVPRQFAALPPDFHCLIQLPGAFIVR